MKLRNSTVIIAIIVAVALPATLSVVAYMITKDPRFRPLARTLNDEEIYNGGVISNEIIAYVRWTTGREKNFTQRDLSAVVQRAFGVHGLKVRMEFEQVDATDAVTITYKVGRNTLGPHPVTKAADSIKGAIAVYRMYQMYRKPAPRS